MSSVVQRLAGQDGFGRGAHQHSLRVLAGVAAVGVVCGSLIAIAGLDGLYLCASLIGCAFILHDFRVGVVLLIVLLPLSGSYVFPHAMLAITGLNPLNLLLIGTLASCLLHGIFARTLRGFLPRPLLWLYVVPIVVAGALGARHVTSIPSGFYEHKLVDFLTASGYIRDLVIKPLLMVLFALLLAAAVRQSTKPERFLIPTLVSIWAMSLMAIVYYGLGSVALGTLASSDSRDFFSALGLHANELGRLYGVAYALLLFTWAGIRGPALRAALLASMGVTALALLLTFSRGAFVGFVVINLLYLWWNRSFRTLVFVAALAVGALFFLPEAVYERASAGFGGGLDAISAGRIQGLWLPLIPEFLRSPVFGSGLGSMLWSDAMRRGAGVTIIGATHPHNAYLEALLDMGVVGLALLCAYFLHVWRGLRAMAEDAALDRALQGFARGAAAGLLALLVTCITDSSLMPKPEHAFLWTAIGIMYGVQHRRAGR
ncbi:MAG TPA: O-antigen ligase family protein [Steroidobacteraceae bacterium]|nr:O-antigen ligase family protein [Steroidobacteraceae bacterium]